jgi:hypothetical protein
MGMIVFIYDADCNVNPSKMDFTHLEDKNGKRGSYEDKAFQGA